MAKKFQSKTRRGRKGLQYPKKVKAVQQEAKVETKVEVKVETPVVEESFEDIIGHIHNHVGSALDATEAKDKFNSMVIELEEKEKKLKETISNLENTKNTVQEEISARDKEEQELLAMLESMNTQKIDLETQILGHEQNVENLKVEREKLNVTLDRMKNVLVDLRTKASDLGKLEL